MAAAGPLPAAHAPTTNIHKRQSLNLDPYLLAAKLEAAKRELDHPNTMSSPSRERRKSTPNAVFVPRSAAKQFAATTTSTTYDAPARARSTRQNQKRQSFTPVAEEPTPQANPKQTFAALNIGLSEFEAARHALPASPPTENTRQRRTSSTKPRGSTDGAPKRTSSNAQKRSVDIPARSPSTRAYRPGDAHKRLSAAAYPPPDPSNTRLIATVQPDGTTTYSTLALPETNPFAAELEGQEDPAGMSTGRARRVNANALPYDMPMPGVNAIDETKERPGLFGLSGGKDRPNWAQQSQCGDDMRSTFLRLGHKSKRSGAKESPLSKEQGSGSGSGSRPAALRRHSSAPQSGERKGSGGKEGEAEGHLVGDAVARLRKEEKGKRRSSLMGFFKKL